MEKILIQIEFEQIEEFKLKILEIETMTYSICGNNYCIKIS